MLRDRRSSILFGAILLQPRVSHERRYYCET